MLRGVASDIDRLKGALSKLEGLVERATAATDLAAKAKLFTGVRSQGEKVRAAVDALEATVADRHWPVPKYRHMLLSL